MNSSRDPDTVIAAWLDDGPAVLPDYTQQAIAVGIRTVARRRPGIPWPVGNDFVRSGLNHRRAALVAAAITVLAIIGASALPGLRQGLFAPGGLPTSLSDWSQVQIDRDPTADGVISLAASPSRVLAIVAAADDGPARLYSSADGRIWSRVPADRVPEPLVKGVPGSIAAQVGATIAAVGNRFLLLGAGVWSSTDGEQWQEIASPAGDPDLSAGRMLAAIPGGPGLVAVGSNNKAWYSSDGSDWSLAQVPPPPDDYFRRRSLYPPVVSMFGVAEYDQRLIAWGFAQTQTESRGLNVPLLWTSTDGRTWVSVGSTPDDVAGLVTAGVGPHGFVRIDSLSRETRSKVFVSTSRDGQTWRLAQELGLEWFVDDDGRNRQLVVSGIAASAAGYVAAGDKDPVCLFDPCEPSDVLIWTSSDGQAWSRLSDPEQFTGAGSTAIVGQGSAFLIGGSLENQPVVWTWHPRSGESQ